MKKRFLLSLCAALVTAGCALKNPQISAAAPLSAASQKLPPASAITFKGTSAIAPDWRQTIVTRWRPNADFGRVETSADGLKLITTAQPEHIYSLQAQMLNQIPLAKGDTLLVRFAARSLQAAAISGVTKLAVAMGKASPDWDNSYKGEISLAAEWRRYDIPFTSKGDFAPDEAQFTFTFGFPAQQAEIADVQILRFGPEVMPASLPKTKRAADSLPPAVVKAELDRVAKMKAELDAVKDPSPANGTVIYVEKTGNTTGDGSKTRPFATIPQALAIVKPGDTIQVGAGEYIEPRGISFKTSGRADAWIHLQAAPGARPKIVTSNWSGIEMRGGISYIEVKGFELEWVPDAEVAKGNPNGVHGSGIAMMYASHHIRALNNVVHGYGTGGIISLDCDYLTVEGNTIYSTAKTSPYGGSAISLCRAFTFDENPGYHNVVRGNVCYDNELKVSVLTASGGNGKALTDGNGIIIDVFQRSRANPLKPHGEDRDGPLKPYFQRTLIENNLIYDNGGRGIHIFRSDNVDVLNNTTYLNQKSADINAGELTAIEAKNVLFANNIAYGLRNKRVNTQDGSSRVIWKNNLLFGSDDVLTHDGLIQADPQFVAPALDAKPGGFRLKSSSPARGIALKEVAPKMNLSGQVRPAKSPVDLGAF